MSRVCVIGAGAAGMTAAGTAALSGNDVYLYEKNKITGKKLLITGKGRCNVTNNCSNEKFIENIINNGKFLYSAINSFSTADTIRFFEGLGVKLKTERGNRVFPESDKSFDIVKALNRYLWDNNVNIVKENVTDIVIEDSQIKGIMTKESGFSVFDKVVIATGGRSYPLTGSTGDGYRFAKKAGHIVTPLKPSLVPIETEEGWCAELKGLSLKNVSIKVVNDETVVFEDFGEMLFTHFGVSGPIILSASSHIDINDIKNKNRKIKIIIDLKPALTIKQLDDRLLRDFSLFLNKDIENALVKLLPKSLIPVVISLSGIPERTKTNSITREMRANLVKTIKGLTVNVKNFRPIEEAIVTSGGVNVSEINPKTMESKLVKGLYFAGEVIDCDGYTGGFNLQIAFSTGYLAGKSV